MLHSGSFFILLHSTTLCICIYSVNSPITTDVQCKSSPGNQNQYNVCIYIYICTRLGKSRFTVCMEKDMQVMITVVLLTQRNVTMAVHSLLPTHVGIRIYQYKINLSLCIYLIYLSLIYLSIYYHQSSIIYLSPIYLTFIIKTGSHDHGSWQVQNLQAGNPGERVCR